MTAVARTGASQAGAGQPQLRRSALGFPQLLAQSVGLISPTMTAVLIIPLAFSNAGEGTWAAYLFATVMLLFVVFGLNQFAKRSATTGAMYAYVGRGLGPAAGVMSGWTLLWSYNFIAIAGLCGFAIFCQQFINALGIHGTVTPFLWFAISGAACLYIAVRDIRLSAMLTLLFEAGSVLCILALGAVILFGHGFSVDTDQLTLKGASFKGMDFAIVVCIFSLVGFESATQMGGESRNPFRDVPKAVIWSLLLTGGFMVVMGYIEVYGMRRSSTSLATLGAPLNTLAAMYGASFFKIPISIGAMVSFFSLTLTCLNAGARIMLPLAGHGFFPRRLHATHARNFTPHMAIGLYLVPIVSIPVILHACGTDPLTIFNDAGTLAAFGFLLAYFMVTLAAPLYLRSKGELKPGHIAIAVIAFLCLLVPTVGSFYPAPPYPVKLFPYLFLGYLAIGGSWLFVISRKPGILKEIQSGLGASLYASMVQHGTAPQPEAAPTGALA